MPPGPLFIFNHVRTMSQTGAQKIAIIEAINRLHSQAKQSHQNLPYLIKKTVPRTDISARLAAGKGCKWFWKSRDGRFKIGGIGPALSFDSPNALDHQLAPCPIVLSGSRFSAAGTKDESWKDFPDCIQSIPKRMFIRDENNFFEAVCLAINNATDIESLIAEAEDFLDELPPTSPHIAEFIPPILLSKKHHPDFDGWRRNVEKGLAAIASGTIEKIVLARRTDYQFDQAIEPVALLHQLMTLNPNAYAFMHQPRPGTAFISLSPERLYRRSDGLLEIDALSSTVPRGITPEDDRRLEKELLESDKLRHEQQLVIDGITAAITPIVCDQPAIGRTSVLKLDRIQHLITPITGRLRDGIGNSEILASLHPTPAVGGTPRDTAVKMIRELEPFDRGWYAGPIGLITEHQAEFAVGIRSLLIHDETISVFTGAGIVAGSDPEAEWHEIDSKNILHPLLIEQVTP